MGSMLSILVTAIVGYAIGMAWYSPMLFGNQWMKLTGLKMKKTNMTKVILLGFVGTLLTAYGLKFFVKMSGSYTFWTGAAVGFWVWLAFLVPVLYNSVLYDGKNWRLFVINASHYFVALYLMAGILGVW